VKNILARCVTGLGALFLVNLAAHAAVVYDNFGSGMSFDVTGGQGIGSTTEAEYGLSFAPSASGYLSQLTVAISSFSGAGEVIFSLYDDSHGQPGNVLESFALSSLPAYGSSFLPQTMTATGSTYLDASRSYWLIAAQPNYPDTAVWQNSTVVMDTLFAFRDTIFTSWVTQIHGYQWALRVETGAVPAPGAIWLFCSGLLGLLRICRYRKLS